MSEQDAQFNLQPDEELKLHQLRIKEYWFNKQKDKLDQSRNYKSESEQKLIPNDQNWILTRDINLYDWQKECVEKWFQNKKGTIKVVTGAGKTILALAIIEKLRNEVCKDLYVVIVVPTIVLMNQWYDEIMKRSNLPADLIGRLGGGFKEDFGSGKRILITVLATAYKELPSIVDKCKIADKLLFIADECHRLGAKEMSRIFQTKRAYNLGLSATPEREENEITNEELYDDESDIENKKLDYDETTLGKELGDIIFNFTYVDGLEKGLIPKFEIRHFGIELTIEERQKYEQLTREINKLKDELSYQVPIGRNIYQYARLKAKSKKISPEDNKWLVFTSKISQRKALLYDIGGRHKAIINIIENELKNNGDARIIIFHEKIDSVMKIFAYLEKQGFPVIAEHSDLPDSIREKGLDLFRKGIAKIIVSARSLIEGFNVPEIDVGIIAASSTSVRQRIQSIGRVLRKHKTATGEEKNSVIYTLYAHNTVDEEIYRKIDWDKITGVDNNIYYLGLPFENPIKQDGSPHRPLKKDYEVDENELTEGCIYQGEYEGEEFTCDISGNIKNANDLYVINAGDLPDKIKNIKGGYGRFKVTPRKNYILVLVLEENEWKTKFVTKLKETFKFLNEKCEISSNDLEEILKNIKTGDEYPIQDNGQIIMELRYSEKKGGVIVKKIDRGEIFAKAAQTADDKEKGEDAENLINAIKNLLAQGKIISKILLNNRNDILFREKGKLYFIYRLKKGLEFPESQNQDQNLVSNNGKEESNTKLKKE